MAISAAFFSKGEEGRGTRFCGLTDLSDGLLAFPMALAYWGLIYGLCSGLLWLYRLLTFNRTKKPLWNLRAGWAVLLGFIISYCTLLLLSQTDHLPLGNGIATVAPLFLNSILFIYAGLSVLDYLRRSRSWQPKAMLGSAFLLAIFLTIVAQLERPRQQWLQSQLPQSQLSGVATLQDFDEHLSLTMPVAFSAVTETPSYTFPPEMRAKVLTAIIRKATFNGVHLTVAKMTLIPGSDYNLEQGLVNVFKRQGNPSIAITPKIEWRSISGAYKSGSIKFPLKDNEQSQMTTVLIQSEGILWAIKAAGTGEAAELAHKTATKFVFR